MTSKEALKLLYSDAENYAYLNETEEDLSEIKSEYELIKQDLERLEELEKEEENSNKAYDVLMRNSNIQFLHQEIFKLKKVIDILKKKQVSSIMLLNSIDVSDYNLYRQDISQLQLTDEEYDLLKEYLWAE